LVSDTKILVNEEMTAPQQQLARLALAILWIFTGVTSVFFAPEIGYEVLTSGGIIGPTATTLIYLGSALDILIGLWVLTGWRLKPCCWLQLTVIISYSLLLTFIAPEYWLHPFGPLTKNIPIAVLIYILVSDTNSRTTGASH
jgi:hypothetical protein